MPTFHKQVGSEGDGECINKKTRKKREQLKKTRIKHRSKLFYRSPDRNSQERTTEGRGMLMRTPITSSEVFKKGEECNATIPAADDKEKSEVVGNLASLWRNTRIGNTRHGRQP